jgi:hypothetical protein
MSCRQGRPLVYMMQRNPTLSLPGLVHHILDPRPPCLPRAPDAHGRLCPRHPPCGPLLPNAARSARGLPPQQRTILQAIPPEAKLRTMTHHTISPPLLTTNPPRSIRPPPPTKTPQKDPLPTGTLPAQPRTRYVLGRAVIPRGPPRGGAAFVDVERCSVPGRTESSPFGSSP